MATEEASATQVFLCGTQRIVDCVDEMSNKVYSLALDEGGKSAIDRELTKIIDACLAISKEIQLAPDLSPTTSKTADAPRFKDPLQQIHNETAGGISRHCDQACEALRKDGL